MRLVGKLRCERKKLEAGIMGVVGHQVGIANVLWWYPVDSQPTTKGKEYRDNALEHQNL